MRAAILRQIEKVQQSWLRPLLKRNTNKIVKQHQTSLTVIMRVYCRTPQHPQSGTILLHSSVFAKTTKSTSENCPPRAKGARAEPAPQETPTAQPTVGEGSVKSRKSRSQQSQGAHSETSRVRDPNLSCHAPTSTGSSWFHQLSQTPRAELDAPEAMILVDNG